MRTLDVLSRSPEPADRKVLSSRPENRQFYIVLSIIIWSVIAYFLISHYVMMAVEIKGASMSPTLLDGQRYILYRAPYLWRAPRKGEIVVIRDPEDHDLSIKRVIGLPNQVIEIRPDGVYIDNCKLDEPYLTSEAAWASGHKVVHKMTLGPQDYYVLGDNRDRSADSRIYGPVPRNFILGVISKSE